MKKNIKRIGVLVVLGIMVLVLCAPTPSDYTYGGGNYNPYSWNIIIDYDNDADDEVFAVWHDRETSGTPSGEELFRIQEDGKVGIGETNPTHKLDVNGSVRVRDLPQDNTLDDIVVADANGVLHVRDVNTIGGPINNGGPATNIITVLDDYTPTNSDYTILVDASSANVRIELPPAADVPGQILVLKRIDEHKSNKVIIDADGSERIDGTLTIRLNVKFMSYTIQSDGSDWYIIASYGSMGRSHLHNKNR